MDNLEVVVEVVDGSLLNKFSELENLEKHILSSFFSVLGLHCKVTLVEPRSIERTAGKAKIIIDLRGKD
jgi:phenylacetate-CoA ligase